MLRVRLHCLHCGLHGVARGHGSGSSFLFLAAAVAADDNQYYDEDDSADSSSDNSRKEIFVGARCSRSKGINSFIEVIVRLFER